jgi:hypothetical protein
MLRAIFLFSINVQRSHASNQQVNKAKLTPTDRNNATDEKLLSVALFLSVGKTCSVCKDFWVSKSKPWNSQSNLIDYIKCVNKKHAAQNKIGGETILVVNPLVFVNDVVSGKARQQNTFPLRMEQGW